MNLDTLVAALAIDEGLRLRPYRDTAEPPNWTIAYGHKITDAEAVAFVGGVTPEWAHDTLVNDAIHAAQRAAADVPGWLGLNDTRQNVLANMAFNLGALGAFKVMLAALAVADFKAAAAAMLDSHWARQVGARATRLANEMLTGDAHALP